jgi:predicted nucleic acid-binding protein
MPFLFDTDAVSEVLRKRPASSYLLWLARIPPVHQLTSAVVIGELCKGAVRSPDSERHLANIETRVLSSLTVLPFDVAAARVYGVGGQLEPLPLAGGRLPAISA